MQVAVNLYAKTPIQFLLVFDDYLLLEMNHYKILRFYQDQLRFVCCFLRLTLPGFSQIVFAVIRFRCCF